VPKVIIFTAVKHDFWHLKVKGHYKNIVGYEDEQGNVERVRESQ
jgi:hypothetical protein